MELEGHERQPHLQCLIELFFRNVARDEIAAVTLEESVNFP